MSAVLRMVPAVKAAIATGVVDPKRVVSPDIHGAVIKRLSCADRHLRGGYRRRPLTDLIGMYGLIYKNSGVTNGEIFESSRDALPAGPGTTGRLTLQLAGSVREEWKTPLG
jgi:hypothetical protein